MNSMTDEVISKLNEFNQIVEKNELQKDIADPRTNKKFDEIKDIAALDGPLGNVVNDIAKSGEIKPYEWKKIKTLLLF